MIIFDAHLLFISPEIESIVTKNKLVPT